jgi:hypothetical protein
MELNLGGKSDHETQPPDVTINYFMFGDFLKEYCKMKFKRLAVDEIQTHHLMVT